MVIGASPEVRLADAAAEAPPCGVDVIVPCYNYGRFLRACTASVLAETRIPIRVLIIDDASADNSALQAERIAAEDPRVRVVHHGLNRGHIATYNEGLAWAQARYLLLLSADDLVAPGALARAVELMEREPQITFVYGRAATFAGEADLAASAPDRVGPAAIKKGAAFIRERCADTVNPVETATAVVRTAVQKRAGGYRPELPHAGDLEMWLRCAAFGDVGYIDALQGLVRAHPDNMRKGYGGTNFLADYVQRYEAFRAFFEGPGAWMEDAARLQAQAYGRLGRELLDEAGAAFDHGRPYARLLSAALQICPALRRSRARLKLELKRFLRRLAGERRWWAWQGRSLAAAARPSPAELEAVEPPPEAPEVSLVISTRNRAAVLPACLAALAELRSDRRWELVLVDNGSADDTWGLLTRFAAAAPAPVRLVREPRPGLSHARNAGIRAARGRILCFTDDDCYPRRDFIDAVARVFAETDVAFMGGQVLLHDPADAPVCITGRAERALFPPGAFLTTGEIHGACMAFRREVFEQLGLFDPAFGAGAPLKGAEDCDLVARACLSGWKGGFFTEPVVYHHHRRRGADAESVIRGYDVSRGAFFAKLLLRSPGRRKLILRHWLWDTPVLQRPSRRTLVKAWREMRGAARYALCFSAAPQPRLG